MYIQTYIYIYIYIYMYIYIHIYTNIRIYVLYVHIPAVAHDMHEAHPVTLWVEEHLRRMHLNRRRQVAYQQLPVALRIPLRMHRCSHSPCKPRFAMSASKKIAVRNRDFFSPHSPRSISESWSEATWSAEMKGSSFLLYLHSIASRDLSTATVPSWTNLPVIAKSMSWIQNSGMHVAATHTHRYKEEPSGTLPRQTSQLKPMHSRSSLPLPWFPMLRENRNEGSPGGRWPAHWFRAEESYTKSETHRAWVSLPISVCIPLHVNHRTIALVSEVSETNKSRLTKKILRCPLALGLEPF